ncbi:hypothetical protein MPHL43072_06935 [Mycolicibacterium phlei DSM 43072]|uniref:Uncharacterized protein n=1 Tax=Mycolicibacterium phlei DSM 43239 = CCUG 21000 TaxID=1226750 RepID=A0A5N5VD99_MYCPH|nr:hypothetical protein MPHL21000_02575 [Mycolicibacterium phlei DSM 43239 = CCUG 21000]KXW64092.1 hypothetical protein MPHL43072_06935 [Mycolicibacterium phlei DSM 43072]KXW68979.1 hypothetical protein MPHL43239_02630 [Mycolicibacterium phlei DSM 43239 = CCUG 21000]KXW74373.1 hypothetical protein MPHL43070_01275 [Mycolicibacterium phlei DSM 43070]
MRCRCGSRCRPPSPAAGHRRAPRRPRPRSRPARSCCSSPAGAGCASACRFGQPLARFLHLGV